MYLRKTTKERQATALEGEQPAKRAKVAQAELPQLVPTSETLPMPAVLPNVLNSPNTLTETNSKVV